jgi:hypothetical protein
LQEFTSVSQAKPQSRILTCADPTAIRFGSAPLLSAWSPVILRRVNIGADAIFDQKREGQLATQLHPAGLGEIDRLKPPLTARCNILQGANLWRSTRV